MTQITVTISENVRLGTKKLGAAIDDLTGADMEAQLEIARTAVRAGWPGGSYAGYNVPTVYGQTYIRTGNLGASTDWVRMGTAYRVTSDAISPRGERYSVAVLGDAQGQNQGRSFVGRWPLMADVMLKWAESLLKRWTDKISAEAMGL